MFLRERAARGDDTWRSSTGRERLAVITSRTEARKDLAACPPLSRVRRAVPRVVVVSYFVVSTLGQPPARRVTGAARYAATGDALPGALPLSSMWRCPRRASLQVELALPRGVR